MRISREELFMETAVLVSKRSSCLKLQVGVVAVFDNRIIASGYNGVLPGQDPTTGIDDDGNTTTVHAEANIVSYCARKGIALEGCIIYTTLSPCRKCAELLIQSGVAKIIYKKEYRDKDGIVLCNISSLPISIEKYEDTIQDS